MSSESRRRFVLGAITLVESRPREWDWILPIAKSTLLRMAEAVDAPPAVRQKWAKALRRCIADPRFETDSLYIHLSRVAAEFAADD